jgi:hypothetical protein
VVDINKAITGVMNSCIIDNTVSGRSFVNSNMYGRGSRPEIWGTPYAISGDDEFVLL